MRTVPVQGRALSPLGGAGIAAPLLFWATMAVAGCGSPDATASNPAGSSADAVPPPWPSIQQIPTRERLQAELDIGRETALVRAAARVSPAVVTVHVIRTERVQPRDFFESFFLPPGGTTRRTPGLGSGIIVDASGTILTNEHVVQGAERIMVTLPDGRDLEAELLGTDDLTDLAVLRVEEPDLPVAPLGTSRGLMIGEWTIAIGNPFGNLVSNPEPTVTAGVVGALDRHIIPGQGERGGYLGMIQTDAAINPGNSGGALVNALGEVIGVNTSIFTRGGGSEGLGFAIPIDRAVRIAEDLLRHGEVRRAWVGLNVEEVDADEWGRTRGVRVTRVAPGSPAAAAGIREGARLLEAGGKRLVNPLDFEAILLDLRAGDRMEVEGEGVGRVTLVAEELPSLRAARVTVLQDLQLITLTPSVRAERRVLSDEGAVVTGISPELAGQLPLRPGDVLLAINNAGIQRAEQVAEILERLQSARQPFRIYFERNGRFLNAGPYRWTS